MVERPDQGTIRVVIVDDHPVLRDGTQVLLEGSAGIVVVGATGSGAQALPLVERVRPDVLLLDIHLPDLNGIEVARRVRSARPEVAILVVTGYDDAGYVRVLLRLGVRSYLSKSSPGDRLVAAVRAVAEGRTALISEASKVVLGRDTVTLTAREHEVLRLIVAGHRNAEIAEQLSVSVNTVEFHIGKLYQKLGVRSRAEAIGEAREQGLIWPRYADTRDD